MQVELLLHSAAQVVTCASSSPKRGAAMREVGIIPQGAVAMTEGQIVAVGQSGELRAAYSAATELDLSGKVLCPGFIDPHTHVVYGGDRVAEFEQRIQGAAYLDILAAGGGILSTMRATRAASLDELVQQALSRLKTMLYLGTTTAEVKSGYGLDTASELNMLHTIERLQHVQPIELVPTFLGAHAVPPEVSGEEYTALVIQEMLPAVVAWHKTSGLAQSPFFIDVFCEQNAFDLTQSRHILAAGQALGLGVKAHVDEFTSLGGIGAALELGAISVDHLDVTTPADIDLLARSDTIGVILPAVNLNLGSSHFAPARAMLEAGAAIALATDINPGSAPCPSMPLVMGIACRYQKLLPAEAFNASTINAAYAIGLGDKLGSIEVGKQADLLVLDTADYRHVAYQLGGNLVGQVIKKGRLL